MTVVELLTKAREIQAARGLAKDTAEDDNRCVCPIGALKIAGGCDPHAFSAWLDMPGMRPAIEAFQDANGISGWGIPDWVDDETRTAAEVDDAFAKAIALASAEAKS